MATTRKPIQIAASTEYFSDRPALEWVKPPLQARSQQTLERLLDAAEALVEEKGVDGATVAHIARRASSSVGAFYARFDDKDALLRCLFQRFYEQATATAAAALEPTRWDGVGLEDALERLLLFMLAVLRERRGLLVALVLHSAADPNIGALAQRLHAVIAEHLLVWIRQRGMTVAHRDPALAVQMASWSVLSMMESRLVHGQLQATAGDEAGDQAADATPPAVMSDPLLAQELACMTVRYLGLPSERSASEPPASEPPPSKKRPRRQAQATS